MLNNEYMNAVAKIKTLDPSIYEILQSHNNNILKELSTGSHSIQNMLSFINCSFQFISEVHPETKDIDYWDDIQSTLSQLIQYTNRTSSYRYSFLDPEKKSVNLNILLQSLPASLEEAADESGNTEYELYQRNWSFDLDPDITSVLTDKCQLKSALLELICNGLESTPVTSPIIIASKLLSNSSYSICISYESNNMNVIREHTQAELEQPFFTTKPDHAGLGLSIVKNICEKLHGNYILSSNNNKIINTIYLPL